MVGRYGRRDGGAHQRMWRPTFLSDVPKHARPTRWSGATKNVASDVSVGRSKVCMPDTKVGRYEKQVSRC